MEIKYEAYSQIVFRSYQKFNSPEEFINATTLGIPSTALIPNLYWAEGVVFRVVGLATTDSVNKSVIEGKLYWDTVDFAPMPTYRSEIRSTERPNVVFVQNLSNHVVFREVAKALKKLDN